MCVGNNEKRWLTVAFWEINIGFIRNFTWNPS